MFILTDGAKNRYWVLNILEPASGKIVTGEMSLQVDVVGFTRSMDAAKKKILDESLKG